jgi:hypothetical protein
VRGLLAADVVERRIPLPAARRLEKVARREVDAPVTNEDQPPRHR